MTDKLALCLIATALGASAGCGGTEPRAKEPRAAEPPSETSKMRETRTFEEEPVLTPASRELTEREQKKPKPTPESASAPPVDASNKRPHPLSDESWGTAPWGNGPWGE